MQILVYKGPPSSKEVELAHAAREREFNWIGGVALLSLLGMMFGPGWSSLLSSIPFIISGVSYGTISSPPNSLLLEALSADQCAELAWLMQESTAVSNYVEQVNQQNRVILVAELLALRRVVEDESDVAKRASVYGKRVAS